MIHVQIVCLAKYGENNIKHGAVYYSKEQNSRQMLLPRPFAAISVQIDLTNVRLTVFSA